jgi:hypothetical protein
MLHLPVVASAAPRPDNTIEPNPSPICLLLLPKPRSLVLNRSPIISRKEFSRVTFTWIERLSSTLIHPHEHAKTLVVLNSSPAVTPT